MKTSRLEAFSDGVFAIAATLLVIEIHVPQDTDHLAHALLELWPSYLAYVISFILVALVWANHHVMLDRIRAADRMLLFLNTLLLMNVASLPFVAALLAAAYRNGSGQRPAVVAYGLVLVIGGLFFNAIWEHARRRPALLRPDVKPAQARTVSRSFLLGPALYAIATAIAAAVPALGLAAYAALILLYWLPLADNA